MDMENRRDFIKKFGLSTLPLVFPAWDTQASTTSSPLFQELNFIYDGLDFSPKEYLEKLVEIDKASQIEPDFYGNEGAVKQLEIEFAKITGKEKAIYLPTGTMANQLAIKLLSSGNTKVFVPENSHVFRDEADASQSVHGKRLIPVGTGKSHFDASDLKQMLDYLDKGEVFKSGLGTVVIENPVRRADGAFVPIEIIKDISGYCRENGIKLHLDGARIHLASSFANVKVSEYASYFDTIYISLYKYLNAAGGAMLCGDAKLIEQVPHQIKIYGGTVYQNWMNAAMALHYLNGIDQRWGEVTEKSKKLILELNKVEGTSLTPIVNGTNIYSLKLDKSIKIGKFRTELHNTYGVSIGPPDSVKTIRFCVNETLLRRSVDDIVKAWQQTIEKIKLM